MMDGALPLSFLLFWLFPIQTGNALDFNGAGDGQCFTLPLLSIHKLQAESKRVATL